MKRRLCQARLLRLLKGEFEAGWQDYERVLQSNPGNEAVLWSRSLLRLANADFTRGWQDYEYRWTQPGFLPRLPGPAAAGMARHWRAKPFSYLPNRAWATPSSSFVTPLVKQRGGTVLFGCQAPVARICAGVAGVDQLIAPGMPVPPFDVQAPLLSLPGIFGTVLATIPATVPYLRADPGLVDRWSKELNALDGFKVGIVWQGSPKHKADRYRSVPLAHFEALARPKGARLLSLQVGPGTEQLAAAAFPIADLGSRFDSSSLDDLAAVLMNLDLVVTIDTAVAHVAGALGVPVWVILPVSADWRWLRQRADSPWYPTMRLFRQQRLGDWDEMLKRVALALHELIDTRPCSSSRGPR